MKNPLDYFQKVGICLICGGMISAIAGSIGIVRIMRQPEGVENLTVGQFAMQLMIPHIFAFIGLGCAVFGSVLIGRAIVMRRDERKYASPNK